MAPDPKSSNPYRSPFLGIAESIAGKVDPDADAEIDAYFSGKPLKSTKMIRVTGLEKLIHEWTINEPKSSHECAADVMNLLGSELNVKKD